jgi:hypothetical protein
MTSSYSFIDKLTHRLAFSSLSVQVAISGLENEMFAADIAAVEDLPPVFVTGLPRAGTTLMLETLCGTDFASHTYRDMPFILCPVWWNDISKKFRKPLVYAERAHGDGVMVGFDSVEAFDEVLWRAHWPGKYHSDRIEFWSDQEYCAEFTKVFRVHMRKVLLARRREGKAPKRYLSKNNANIARIGLLSRMFPDANIVVLFRNPLDHAQSCLRQHRQFAIRHQRDRFARDYMRDIGHFEFGACHRPLMFPGMEARADTFALGYWLAYWTAVYRNLLRQSDKVTFVGYDALLSDPCGVLNRLADRLGLERAVLAAQAQHIRPPKAQTSPTREDAPELTAAEKIYDALQSLQI